MSTPRAFLDFFDGPFQRELERVDIPDMPDASWDRRAAWLLWTERGGDQPKRDKPAQPAASPSMFD